MSPRKARGWKVWVERGGENWRCRWSGKFGTGQEVFVRRDDALEFAKEKRRDFERMDVGLPPAERLNTAITVLERWNQYSKTKSRDNPETFRRFDTPALSPFVEKHGAIALAAITEDNIQDYKHWLEDNYSGDAPLMYFRQVCAFFNAAVRSGDITKSPAKSVKKPLSGGGGGRPLLDSEIERLFANAYEGLYRTGTFSLNTFLRINEICILDWRWVWDIDIRDAAGKIIGSGTMGRIPAELRKTRAKTVYDCVFPINAAAREMMGPRKASGRVFPWSIPTIQHQMTAARKKGGLPDDITFHCFRHTAADRYLGQEGPDGGHMEDLLKTHIWEDPRSLLRYVRPSHQVLYRRFSASQFPVPAPNWPLNAQGRRPGASADGPA